MNRFFGNTFLHRVLYKSLFALVMPVCALWAGVSLPGQSPGAANPAAAGVEWPSQWDGRPLRPLALSEVEQRFSRQFPGAITRMTDGRQVLVLRQVHQPTRMLHPAADCYRSLGYAVEAQQLEQDAQARLWRCFTARRGTQLQRVCERIEDAQGNAFTDTSAWYWAAVSARSSGPWQAITVARSL